MTVSSFSGLYERLDYGSDDGSIWGNTTDKLGFYGTVPVTVTSVPQVSSGVDTSTVVSSLVAALKRIGIVT